MASMVSDSTTEEKRLIRVLRRTHHAFLASRPEISPSVYITSLANTMADMVLADAGCPPSETAVDELMEAMHDACDQWLAKQARSN